MTIQTDLNEIEKGCSKSFNFYAKESMCYINLNCGQWKEITSTWNKMEWCEVCKAKRQTFIEENLKRINEMIEKIDYTINVLIDENFEHNHIENCWVCNLIDLLEKYSKRLEADKKFLEEKQK